MNIDESIKNNLLFNEPKINNKFLTQINFKKKNIKIIDIENTNFEKNKYYTNLIRRKERLGNGYKFSYVSPTDLSNNLEIVLPKVEINVSYKFIFFVSSWCIENIEKFELVNGEEIICLKSQINSTFTNYLNSIVNTKVENISLNISFKKKQIYGYPNGLYLLNNFCMIKTSDKIYNTLSINKDKEINNISKSYDFVICIAIWNRHTILKKIINLVNSYKLNFSVGFVLIYSQKKDNNLFPNTKNVHFFYSANQPLGSKWLASVYHSQLFNPKAIMILGSDDIVSRKYLIEGYYNVNINNFDFCYSENWLTYASQHNLLYKQKYRTPHKILGAGRIFSSKFLKKVDNKIYDPTICRGLDNTFKFIKTEKDPVCHVMNELGILLYKGKWECISDIRTLIISKSLLTWAFDNDHPYTQQIAKNFGIKLEKKATKSANMGTMW